MEPMVIEVHGVPHILTPDWMADQLKIHFLKRRNNGGDVLTVIYPTSTPGQAYVIFESDEVPGVLEFTHVLEADNTFYPIHVKKANFSEVDMPVEAKLNLKMFPKPDSVLKLLKSHDLNITKRRGYDLQLKGSFLKLKLLRNQLMQLQGQQHSRSPPALHNGSSLSKLLDNAPSLSSSYRDSGSVGSPRSLQSSHSSYNERNASSPVNVVAQKFQWQDSNELLAHKRSLLADGASSLSANSPSNHTQLHHTSPLYRDSGSPRSLHSSYYSSIGSTSHTADMLMQQQNVMDNEILAHRRSPLANVQSSSKKSTFSPSMQHCTPSRDSASDGSLRRRPSFDGDTSANYSPSSPPSSSGGIATFSVDTDIINFILIQRQDVVKLIEKSFGTEMKIKDDAGITMVIFSGKNSEKAKAHLLDKIKEISSLLRTQEIHLKKYDRAEQKQILERIPRNKDSGVVITHSNDIVKLVGYSGESFEVMQKILGHSDDFPRGRAIERGSKSRRSSSLPRQYKMADHAHRTDPENQASATNKYLLSGNQVKSDEGKSQQIVQEKKSLKQQSADLLKRLDINYKNFDFKKVYTSKK